MIFYRCCPYYGNYAVQFDEMIDDGGFVDSRFYVAIIVQPFMTSTIAQCTMSDQLMFG